MSQVLFESSVRPFSALAAVPSNVEALKLASHFSAGLNTFGAIVGPSGWGKTHILECVAYRLAHSDTRPLPTLPARDWLDNPGRVDPCLPLLLDDAQEVLRMTRTRLQLRLALERRVRAGRQTMLCFTAEKPNRQIKSCLPSLHEWTIAELTDPQPVERQLIVQRMCVTEGLTISTALAKLMALHMRGNGRTLQGALKRLSLEGRNWSDMRATLKAVGVLDAFFADNPSWDLKEGILLAVEGLGSSFAAIDKADLALYTMLHEAELPEAEVARLFRIEPAVAYQRASAFRTRLECCQTSAQSLRQLLEIVVDGLLRD